jgi:hypothetical protein
MRTSRRRHRLGIKHIHPAAEPGYGAGQIERLPPLHSNCCRLRIGRQTLAGSRRGVTRRGRLLLPALSP